MNYYPFVQNNDTFMGYYVVDYNTVLNTPAPTNGSAILFVNLDQGMLWAKKMNQGQAYIQPYHISPINNEGSPKEPVKQEDLLNSIMIKLNNLENEIKGVKDEYKPTSSQLSSGTIEK